MTPFDTVLHFWFDSLQPAQWWTKDLALDERIRQQFGSLHTQASAGELFPWRDSAEGRLAEVLVLDQFSRHLFRDSARAFAQDGMALALAQEAIAQGFDRTLTPVQRSFLYLPFMHSESALIHEQALRLYTQNGLAENLDFELRHKAIIDRFGRYPHRNAALGRISTAEEIAFLQEPGSSF